MKQVWNTNAARLPPPVGAKKPTHAQKPLE